MRIEALKYKTEDKTEIIVCINFCESNCNTQMWQICDIKYRPYRKKNFISLESELESKSRFIENPTYERKQEYIQNKLIEFVGVDVVKKAYITAWEKLKPNLNELL